jgi:hypothetical protein
MMMTTTANSLTTTIATNQKLRLSNGRTVVVRPLKQHKDNDDDDYDNASIESNHKLRTVSNQLCLSIPCNSSVIPLTQKKTNQDVNPIKITHLPNQNSQMDIAAVREKLYLPDGRSVVFLLSSP